MKNPKIKDVISNSDIIATIGSPIYIDEFMVTFRRTANRIPLYNSIACFLHKEGSEFKIVIGIVTEIVSRNEWHESKVLKPIVRDSGSIPYLSDTAIVKEGRIQYLTALKEENKLLVPTEIGTPPISGTEVHLFPRDLFKYIKVIQGWYMGYLVGSGENRIPLPLSIRSFDDSKDGLKEARFSGVFGKTGSGKSITATQLIVSYSKFEKMGILILDPQGEFAKNKFSSEDFEWNFHAMVKTVRPNNKIVVLNLSDLSFSSPQLFGDFLLSTNFIRELTNSSRGDYENDVANWIVNQIQREGLNNIQFDRLREMIGEGLRVAYSSERVLNNKLSYMNNQIENRKGYYENLLNQIRDFFLSDRENISNLVRRVIDEKWFIILDLSSIDSLENIRGINPDEIRRYMILEILREINEIGRSNFGNHNNSSESLIVIDEAHYYVPEKEETNNESRDIAKSISQMVKTTRKYGIGWLFITQMITDFSKDIYKQLYYYYFLYGLGLGTDKRHVKEVVGADNYRIYESISDPKATKLFKTMVKGDVVSISTKGAPIVYIGCSSDKEFMELNGYLDTFEKIVDVNEDITRGLSGVREIDGGNFSAFDQED